MKKKILAAILAVAMILGIASGCAPKNDDDNTISITINRNILGFEKVLVEKFPDINFNFEYYFGKNTSEYLTQQLMNDDSGDIIMSTLKFSDDLQKEHLLDLSGYEFTGCYDINTLNMFSIDGAVYMLPGPLMLRSMAYNKTMFEENGWSVPTNHDELVALVKEIRAESDVTPITFSGELAGFYFTTMTTLAQSGFLSTPDGYDWEKRYLAGEASSAEGFGEGIALLQELIYAGAYDIDEDDGHSDPETVNKFVNEKRAAMMAVWANQAKLGAAVAESDDEFGLFPFYGKEDGSSFLGTNCSVHFAINKHLGEDGNEKKLENAIRILEFISSEEGMNHLVTGETDVIPLKGVESAQISPMYQEIWNLNLNGQKAFMLYAGYEDIIIQTGEFIREAMRNRTSLDGITEMMDEIHKTALAKPEEVGYGVLTEDLDWRQTAQLQANILDDAGAGDFALLSLSGYKNGIANITGSWGKLYKGTLGVNTKNMVIPNRTGFELLTLTGAKIKEIIASGKVMEDENGNTASFEYFWSGIDVEFEGDKIISVKLDGVELDDNETYKVDFPQGDYSAEIAEIGNPTLAKATYESVFIAYFKNNSPVEPPVMVK